MVKDGDFSGSSAIQTVDKGRVAPEHLFFVRFRGHLIIDVRKAEGFCVPSTSEENPVLPDFLNGDHVLDTARNYILLPILPQEITNGFHQFLYASLSWLEMVSSNNL